MKQSRRPQISARKRPQQDRSNHLVSDILEAAARVLIAEGAQRFTTARVAARAGVSVGSLYQYFPNKESILFRLQSDEWKQTGELLDSILIDRTMAPPERLRRVVREFFRSECEEADLRAALGNAAPLYRHAPEAHSNNERGRRRMLAFMEEALPDASAKQRTFCAKLVRFTMSAVGKTISEQGCSSPEVTAYAAAIGDMLCAHLRSVNRSVRE